MFVIIAENEDLHADAVSYYLQKAGGATVRLCPRDLVSEEMLLECHICPDYADAILTMRGRSVRASTVAGVYCREYDFPYCPPEASLSEHLQLSESKTSLLAFFHKMNLARWVNPPERAAWADNKYLQGVLASAAGLAVPDTLITNNPSAFLNFYQKHSENVIIKQMSDICLVDEEPFQDAQGRPDCHVYGFYTRLVTQADLSAIETLRASPCLFQEAIPKKADLRVTVVGRQCFTYRIDSQSVPAAQTDFRRVPDLPVEAAAIPTRLEQGLVDLVASMGLSFAACDIIEAQDGRFVFLEANVNGNWLWLEREEESRIAESIANFLSK